MGQASQKHKNGAAVACVQTSIGHRSPGTSYKVLHVLHVISGVCCSSMSSLSVAVFLDPGTIFRGQTNTSKPYSFSSQCKCLCCFAESISSAGLSSVWHMQAGHLHLSDPGRLEQMMEYLDYGAPDVSSLGSLSADESPW